MKALVLHGPGSYSFEAAWPDPKSRPGWARVAVWFSGICGSDLPRFATTGSYHHPMILGHEFTGIVETPAVGSRRFHGGERVAVLPLVPCGHCAGCAEGVPFRCRQYEFLGSRNDGGFAQLCLVPEDNLLPLPDGVDLRLGTLVEPSAVALHVVRRSGMVAGQSALVLGAGPIGLLIAFWLERLGASRTAVADVRSQALSIAGRAGFRETLFLGDGAVCGAQEFDCVFEAAGSDAALCCAIEAARSGGTIAVVGRNPGDTRLPHALFEKLMRRELTLVGAWGYLPDDGPSVVEALLDARFHLEALITQEVSLSESPSLLRQMIDKTVYYCKAIIDVAREEVA